jgi:hypothetical protein
MKESGKFNKSKKIVLSEKFQSLDKGNSIENKKKVEDTVKEVLDEYKEVFNKTGDTFDKEEFYIGTNTVALGSTDYTGQKIEINGLYIQGNNDFLNERIKSGIDTNFNANYYGDIRDTVVHEMGHNVFNKIYRHTEIKDKYGEIKYPSTDGADNFNMKFRKAVQDSYQKEVFGLKRGQRLNKVVDEKTYNSAIKEMYPSGYSKTSPSETNAENFLRIYYKKKNNVELTDFENIWVREFNKKIKEMK